MLDKVDTLCPKTELQRGHQVCLTSPTPNETAHLFQPQTMCAAG